MAKRSKATAKNGRDELADIPDPANGAEFDALSDADKEKIYNYYNTHKKLTGLRKPTESEQKVIDGQVEAEPEKFDRPAVGEGATQITVTIEHGLLRQVDEYAKAHGMKRTQLITQGLRAIVGKPQKSA